MANLANLTPKLTLIEFQVRRGEPDTFLVRRGEPGTFLVRRGEPGEPDT